MGNFDVIQRTSDGMFNATALLKQWNKNHPKNQRDLDNFWKSTHLDKLMSEIVDNEYNFKTVDFTELKNILSKTSRGKYNGGTYMHPILFIKFAMYLNSRFEYHVLRFVSDELIKYRHEAGDNYRQLSKSIAAISNPEDIRDNIKKVAKAMNWVVFNKQGDNLRNTASEIQIKELSDLEKDICKFIDFGFIKSLDQLIIHLRGIWANNWKPKELSISNRREYRL